METAWQNYKQNKLQKAHEFNDDSLICQNYVNDKQTKKG